jgi:DmsE family decaheme c-type cytochrome
MRRCRMLAVATAGIALLAWSAVPTIASAQQAPTYIGSKACAKCHEDVADAFKSNPHHMAEMDGSVVAEHVGCEGCHGPGSEHAAAEGDDTDPRFKTIRVPSKLKPAESSAICQSCHRTGEQMNWAQSPHSEHDVACISCHSIHSPKSPAGKGLLKAAVITDLCITCHKDKRAAITSSAHMPIKEGGMTCYDCHNPHGSSGPHQIRANSNTELCVSCHTDKRGPFLWEHPPVRENCVTCHQPHGSNNDKVLAGKRPFLCQRCHIATRHPSTLYDKPDLVSNRLFNRSCTNCHSQIHGSNHPSGEFFLR